MLVGLILLSLMTSAFTKYTCRQYNTGHITCQARNAACQITDDHALSYSERHEILEAHNQLRREAAKGLLRRFGLPEAANMKKLEYDDELANNAQAHVEVTCQLHHDQPWQRLTGAYPDVGQNVYITEVRFQKLQEDTWTNVIENLWGKNEAAMLRGNSFGKGMTLRGYDLHATGHLTQLLWADTEKVGCGKIIFNSPDGSSDLRTCDYGEGGNVIGAEMYIEGPACSACPTSHPYCEDGLCSRIPPATFGYTGQSSYQSQPTPNYYSSGVAAPYGHSAYSPPTSYNQQSAHVERSPAKYSWWNSGSQASATPQINYYSTFHSGSAGSPSFQNTHHNQRTYNYQAYTVLQRKKRGLRLPLKSSRVL